MTLHPTHAFHRLLKVSALAVGLTAGPLAAAAPAAAFDYGYGGGCCCDDGRYDSVGFGAAGTRGGLGLGGIGGGLGRGLGGLGGLGGNLIGSYGAPVYGGAAYSVGYGGGYGDPGEGGLADVAAPRSYDAGPIGYGALTRRAPLRATARRLRAEGRAAVYAPRRAVVLRRYD